MKNIAYIISNIHKSLGFEWLAMNLDKAKYNLSFILINESETPFEKFLTQNNFKVSRIKYRGKKDIIPTLLQVYKIIKKQNIHIVHTHLFDANIIGLTAAKFAGIKKRIHTRHHAMFHHNYFPKAVYYDQFINYLSTDIVAPSKNVSDILIQYEKVKPAKVKLIHHGFDLDAFEYTDPKKILSLQKKYSSSGRFPVIGVISRYIELKGLQYIIPAFKNLLLSYPDAYLILANGNGTYKAEIKKLLMDLPASNYIEIEFEEDIFSLYKLFNIFIHAPLEKDSEAFGQTYVEALASGIPSVFTLSGVASEFIVDKKNALVVNYKNSDEITFAIKYLLENSEVRNELIAEGKVSVRPNFLLSKMISSLEDLYG